MNYNEGYTPYKLFQLWFMNGVCPKIETAWWELAVKKLFNGQVSLYRPCGPPRNKIHSDFRITCVLKC